MIDELSGEDYKVSLRFRRFAFKRNHLLDVLAFLSGNDLAHHFRHAMSNEFETGN